MRRRKGEGAVLLPAMWADLIQTGSPPSNEHAMAVLAAVEADAVLGPPARR